jgi:hypothetical protein
MKKVAVTLYIDVSILSKKCSLLISKITNSTGSSGGNCEI